MRKSLYIENFIIPSQLNFIVRDLKTAEIHEKYMHSGQSPDFGKKHVVGTPQNLGLILDNITILKKGRKPSNLIQQQPITGETDYVKN